MDFGETPLYLQFLQTHLARVFHLQKCLYEKRMVETNIFNHFISDKSSVTHASSLGRLIKSISENW